MNHTENSRKMPWWQWILFFILGIIVFLFVYGAAQTANQVHALLPGCLLRIIAAVFTLLLYYWSVRWIERRKIDELDRRHMLPDTGRGLIIGFAFFVIVVGLMYLFGLYRVDSVEFDAWGLLAAFLSYLVVAVGEEVLFRGIIFRMIDQQWGTVAALIASSLVFGFAHMMEPSATVWSSAAIAIEAGLLLGAAYKFSGNLWMPIGIHWAWNFTQGDIFGIAVSGHDSGAAILTPVLQGPDILTGGGFGAEASIISVVLGAALSVFMLVIYYRRKKTVNE